jgi:hypothetical protein
MAEGKSMTVKTSGKDFKGWYGDIEEWPQDAYHEDEIIKINGRNLGDDDELQSIDDNAIISLSGGCIYFADGRDVSMEGALRRWLRKKSHEESFDRILVEIPKGKRTAFVFHVECVGGKVLA